MFWERAATRGPPLTFSKLPEVVASDRSLCPREGHAVHISVLGEEFAAESLSLHPSVLVA